MMIHDAILGTLLGGIGMSFDKIKRLRTGDGVTVYDIARALNISPNMVYQHIDALEEAGLIRRAIVVDGTVGRPASRYTADLEQISLHYIGHETSAIKSFELKQDLQERASDYRLAARARNLSGSRNGHISHGGEIDRRLRGLSDLD